MNLFQSRPELKDRAKDIMTGKYSSAIFCLLLRSMLMMFFSSMLLSITTQVVSLLQTSISAAYNTIFSQIVSYIIALFFSIITTVFNIGFCLFFLNAACNQRFSSANLFYGFQQDFGKSFGICSVLVITKTICLLPCDILLYLYQTNALNGTSWLPQLFILLIIGIIVYIPLSLGLSQCYYLMLDFPQYSAGKIIQLSFRIMKGHKLRLFCLEASFIPLLLINMFTFGIGSLWLTPYITMTRTVFFLDLMNPKKQNIIV